MGENIQPDVVETLGEAILLLNRCRKKNAPNDDDEDLED
jgi:hypothetical protein